MLAAVAQVVDQVRVTLRKGVTQAMEQAALRPCMTWDSPLNSRT